MLVVSSRILNILAAIVWYTGGIILLLKGYRIFMEANMLKPEHNFPWLAVATGLGIGGMKAKFLFVKNCQKNLDRIAALKRPKLWQFYRPEFFVVLTIMILLSANLYKLASNNYQFLNGIAILDLSIAIALLGSSFVFWKQKAFHSSNI